MKGKIANLLQKKEVDPDDFSDEPVQLKVNKGIKKQAVESEIKSNEIPNIQQNVEKLYNNELEQKKAIVDLASKLFFVMKDKTLLTNKSTQQKQTEVDVLGQFNELARVINASETSEDNQGTLAFVIILARSLLIARDRVNDLEYQLHLLTKKVNQMELTIANNSKETPTK